MKNINFISHCFDSTRNQPPDLRIGGSRSTSSATASTISPQIYDPLCRAWVVKLVKGLQLGFVVVFFFFFALGKFHEYLPCRHAAGVVFLCNQWCYGHVSHSLGLAKTILEGTVKKHGMRQVGQRKRWEDNIR